MHTTEKIGQIVKELRLSLGLDQTALAERAGTTQPTISRIENNEYGMPGLDLAQKLCKALGITILELIGEKDPKDDPLMREMLIVAEPMSEYDKKAALGAVKGIAAAGRKAG